MGVELLGLPPTPEIGEPPIVVDGAPHYYLDPDVLSLRQRARIRALRKRADVLEEIEEPSEQDEVEYDEIVMELCRIVLPSVPADVIEALQPGAREALFLAFMVHAGRLATRARMQRDWLFNGIASSSPDAESTTLVDIEMLHEADDEEGES